jgi:hypothetical protein
MLRRFTTVYFAWDISVLDCYAAAVTTLRAIFTRMTAVHSDAKLHGSSPRRVGTRPNCTNIDTIDAMRLDVVPRYHLPCFASLCAGLQHPQETPHMPVAYSIALTYLRDGNIRSTCLRTIWLTTSIMPVLSDFAGNAHPQASSGTGTSAADAMADLRRANC